MRGNTNRTVPISLLLLALLTLLGFGLLTTGCSGDEEVSTDTTEAAGTETTEAAGADTETTGTEMATEDTQAGSDQLAGEPEYEVLDELPDDFPAIELPEDTTLLEVRAIAAPGAGGETVRAVAAAFESGMAPTDQYEHFKTALTDAGFDIAMDEMMVEEPVFFYVLSASNGEIAVIINGGDDPSEFETEFPGAENPFAISAGPPEALGGRSGE